MPLPVDTVYADLVGRVLRDGQRVVTRGHACRRLTFEKLEFRSFPLVSVRRTAWKNALREWEFFMSGSSNINDLHPAVRHWWTPWADPLTGEIRYNYSKQFRRFGSGFDQIAYLIDGVKNHPHSRRNVITTWHTEEMAEPDNPITNCHGSLIQVFVERDGTGDRLHLGMYQRSCDLVLGVPHNWAQYWGFLLWLAYRTDKLVGRLTWVGGDVHVYEEHAAVAEKIAAAGEFAGPPPPLVYTSTSDEFRADDFTLGGPYLPVLPDEKVPMLV